MRTIMHYALTAVILILTMRLSAAFSEPRQLWVRTDTCSAAENAIAAVPGPGGSIIICGRTVPDVPNGRGQEILVGRYDAEGKPFWKRTFGGKYSDEGVAADTCGDGSFVVAGRISVKMPNGYTEYRPWIAKLSAEGSVYWEKICVDTASYAVYDIGSAPDGGAVLAAYRYDYVTGGDAVLFKYDAAGALEWTCTAGDTAYDKINCIQVLPDNSIFFAGESRSYNTSGNTELWYGTVSAEGVPGPYYAGEERHAARALTLNNDKSAVILLTRAPSGNFYRFNMRSISFNAVQQWSVAHYSVGDDAVPRLLKTGDGYVFITNTDRYDRYSYIVGTDTGGARTWYRTVAGAPYAEWINDAVFNNGALVLTGTDDALEDKSVLFVGVRSNAAPIITSDRYSLGRMIPEDTVLAVPVFASDPDGDEVTYYLETAADGWAGIDPESGYVRYAPAAVHIGLHDCRLVVADPWGGADTVEYSLEVTEKNDAPVYAGPYVLRTAVGETARAVPAVSDEDSHDSLLSVTPTGSPVAGFSANAGAITWLPAVPGSTGVLLDVSDGANTVSVEVTLTAGPAYGIAGCTDTSVTENDPLTLHFVTDDAVNGVPVRYALADTLVPATLDSVSGMLTWIPDDPHTGTRVITVICTDRRGGYGSLACTVAVAGVNDPPVILPGVDTVAYTGIEFTYTFPVADPDDGDAYVCTFLNAPPGMVQSGAAGDRIAWTPHDSLAGRMVAYSVIAADNAGAADTMHVVQCVKRFNYVPEVVTAPSYRYIYEDAPYIDSLIANDPEGDPVRYCIISGPAGMAIDSLTGVITWVPDAGDAGYRSIQIGYTDRTSGYDTYTYNLYVYTVNDPPRFRMTRFDTCGQHGAGLRIPVGTIVLDEDDEPEALTFTVPGSTDASVVRDGSDIILTAGAGIDTVVFTLVCSDDGGAADTVPVRYFPNSGADRNGLVFVSDSIPYYRVKFSTVFGGITAVACDDDAAIIMRFGLDGRKTEADTRIPLPLYDGIINRVDTLAGRLLVQYKSAYRTYSLSVIDSTLSEPNRYEVGSSLLDISAGSYNDGVFGIPYVGGSSPAYDIRIKEFGVADGVPEFSSYTERTLYTAGSKRPSYPGIFSRTDGYDLIWEEEVLSTQYRTAIKVMGFGAGHAVTAPARTLDLYYDGEPDFPVNEISGFQVIRTDSGWVAAWSCQNIKPLNAEMTSYSSRGTNAYCAGFDRGWNLAGGLRPFPEKNAYAHVISSLFLVRNAVFCHRYLTEISSDPTNDVLKLGLDGTILGHEWIAGGGAAFSQIQDTTLLEVCHYGYDSTYFRIRHIDTVAFSFDRVPGIPYITSVPETTATEDVLYAYALTIEDSEAGDRYGISLTGAPDGMMVDTAAATLSFVPDDGDVGPHYVTVLVRDSFGDTAVQSFTLRVAGVNDPPVVAGLSCTTAVEDAPYTGKVLAGDDDRYELLSYRLLDAPAGMTVDTVSGALRWTPGAADTGTVRITVSAADRENADTAVARIRVLPHDDAPVITGTPPDSVLEDSLYAPVFGGTDEEGGPVVFSVFQAPPGCAVDAFSGLMAWRPVNGDIGCSRIIISAADTAGNRSYFGFDVTVVNTNDAPVALDVPDRTVCEDSLYMYTVSATDVDPGDVIRYIIVNAPTTFAINGTTGTMVWVPDSADIGTHTVRVAAYDRQGAGDTVAFQLTVTGGNDPPVLLLEGSYTLYSGTPFILPVTGFDEENAPLDILLLSGPDGMTFDGDTVRFTPGNGDIGYDEMQFSISDGVHTDSVRIELVVSFPLRMGGTGRSAPSPPDYIVAAGSGLTYCKRSQEPATVSVFTAAGTRVATAVLPAGPGTYVIYRPGTPAVRTLFIQTDSETGRSVRRTVPLH